MKQHTKGPWYASGGKILSRGAKGGRSDMPIASASIAYKGSAEMEANARLLAAAPALLERLRELVALAELDEENIPGTDLYMEILLAKEVIAEATRDT